MERGVKKDGGGQRDLRFSGVITPHFGGLALSGGGLALVSSGVGQHLAT